jgi:MutS domain III
MSYLALSKFSNKKITPLSIPISRRKGCHSMVVSFNFSLSWNSSWTTGVLNNTKTILGRDLLRQWLLRPSLSLSVIHSRHDAIECFLRPDNLTTSETLHHHLTGIRNVPRILAALKAGKSKTNDWQSLVVVCIEPSFQPLCVNFGRASVFLPCSHGSR